MFIDEARDVVLKYTKELQTEVISIFESNGRVCAESVVASKSQPPFRRSAMDGYAIKRSDYDYAAFDSVSGSTDAEVKFPVLTEIDAGDNRYLEYKEKCAYRIMTGAPVPNGIDWVVQQENTDYGKEVVTILDVGSVDNICPIGEDFSVGDMLIEKGQMIDGFSLASVVASGRRTVQVYTQPAIAVITTGDEVSSSAGYGQIYNSNAAYLNTRIKKIGCSSIELYHVKDDIEEIQNAILKFTKAVDFIITTGGVSVGRKDYIKRSLQDLGAEIMFHGISIKPGMPTMFSVLDGVSILSLSGNPFSASCIFEYLFPYQKLLTVCARLGSDYKKERSSLRVVRGHIYRNEVVLDLQSKNGCTSARMKSNCLVELPAGNDALSAGENVIVRVL